MKKLKSTQNLIDLNYKALSNAGTWFLGRLQTERGKERVFDGLEGAVVTGQKQFSRQYFDKVLSGLGKRIFLMNDVHEGAPVVFKTRWEMSYLRGPLTREQIKLLVEPIKKGRQELGIMPKPTIIQTSTTVASPAELTITGSKPLVPANIREYFMPFEKPMQQHENFAYQPMLIGAARIQYSLCKKREFTPQWKRCS